MKSAESAQIPEHSFFNLTPDRILDCVENALGGTRATGRTFALNSLENRVYQIELESEDPVIAKFYRPGRWNRDQLMEEHAFISALEEAEVPVAPPLKLQPRDPSLRISDTIALSPFGIYFALFPRKRGRLQDELSFEQLEIAGRFIARIHSVGERMRFRNRLELNVATFGRKSLETLREGNWIDLNVRSRYLGVAEKLLDLANQAFDGVRNQTIHGDCHRGNLIWTSEGPCFLDFDDVVSGPPAQDIWLLLPGRDEETDRDRSVLLKAYRSIREFDLQNMKLIEHLRVLRFLHYSAWISKRWSDPTFQRAFSDFQSISYWEEELQALEDSLRWIQSKNC